MPAWNLGDIMSRATEALGLRSDIALSTVSFWANESYEEVWTSLPFDEQEAIAVSSTTVNEDKLTLPTDFLELLSVSNTSENNVLLDSMNEDQRAVFSSQSGTPTHYQLFANWIELRPIPDSAYSLELRYKIQRSDLTLAASVPSVSTRYRRAIMLKTKELLAENVLLDPLQAADSRAAYQSFIDSRPSDRALRTRDQHAVGISLGRRRGQLNRSSRASFDRDI